MTLKPQASFDDAPVENSEPRRPATAATSPQRPTINAILHVLRYRDGTHPDDTGESITFSVSAVVRERIASMFGIESKSLADESEERLKWGPFFDARGGQFGFKFVYPDGSPVPANVVSTMGRGTVLRAKLTSYEWTYKKRTGVSLGLRGIILDHLEPRADSVDLEAEYE